MKHNETITDELIAKYISGNTSEEEEDLIHDYLARNPEFANDLLDIATALRHQHKHDAAIKKEKLEESKEAKRIQITPRRTFYAVAASIVILIGIGLLVFKPFTPPSDNKVLVFRQDTQSVFYSYVPDNDSEERLLICRRAFQEHRSGQTISEEMLVNPSQIIWLPSQTTESVAEPKLKTPLIADNSASEPQPQQEPVSPSDNSDASMMASLTVSEGDDNALQKKDGVFTTDIPQTCNPENGIVLKWNCNAFSLKLEISTDGKTWKTLNNNIIQRNSLTITPSQLKDFEMSNSECFYWRMTAQFSDGPFRKEGIVYYSKEND